LSDKLAKRSKTQLFRLIVSVGLCALLFRYIDSADFKAKVGSVSIEEWLWCLFLLGVQICLVSWRWRHILDELGYHLSLPNSARICSVSSVANNILLNGVGGLACRLFLVIRSGVSLEAAMVSTLAERLIVFFFLSGAAALSLPTTLYLGDLDRAIIRNSQSIGIGFVVAMLLMVAGYLVVNSRISGILAPFRRYIDAITMLLTNRVILWPCVMATLLSQIIGVAVFIIVIRGIGIEVPVAALIAVLPSVVFFASLPISIGGWGVREGGLVASLYLFYVPLEQAITASIIFGALNLVSALLVGAVLSGWPMDTRARSNVGGRSR